MKMRTRYGSEVVMVALMAAVLAVTFGSAWAEDAQKVHDLGEVMVSATRTEVPVFDVPQSVTVISKEEIMASPFDRVEDIVRSVPGIYNFRHYGLQTNGIVNPLIVRGIGQNRVLLLVDGVPQNDNFNNSIAWVGWGHIPKETIERIEIVRGPTSALYGSEGLGGVIHIITKRPKAGRETSVRGEAGTANTFGGHAYHNQKIGDLGFLLAGGYEDSDGFFMVKDPKSYEIKRYRKVGKVLGKVTYDLNPCSDISLAGLYFDQDAGQGREFFHNDLQLDQYWLNYNWKSDAFAVKGLTYLSRADKTAFQDMANDNFTSLNRKEKFKGTYSWGADLQGTMLNWSPTVITVGAAFKEANLDYDEDYPGSGRDAGAKGKQRFISPFANADFRFFDDHLVVNLGARYDWIETSDGANFDTAASAGKPAYDNRYDTSTDGSLSPKLGVAWHPDDRTTVRASGGKGFRAPSLFELYKVQVRGGGTFYREANPDLEPEEIWSYDIGAERYFLDNLSGRLTFYQSFARDYIGNRLIGTATFGRPPRTRFEYKLDNISEVDIYGVEAELQWSPMKELSLFANYTYNISKVAKDDNNAELEGNYLPNDPRHKVHAGLHYQDPRFVNVSLIGNFYADIYYDSENSLKTNDYWTVDVRVWRRFFDRVTAYVNVENLFDREYPIFLSASSEDTIAPGVIVLGGIKVDF